MNWRHYSLDGVIAIAVGILLYFGYLIYEAWYEVHKAPRADMFSCDKHGLVPKEYCLVFEEKEDPEAEQQYQCPHCYDDAFKLADQRLREQERVRT